MKFKLPQTLLALILFTSGAFAADLYQAVVAPRTEAEIKRKKPASVKIQKLSPDEQREVLKSAGIDFSLLPETKALRMPRLNPPIAMLREGKSVRVTCVVKISPEGQALTIYRLGTDSDDFFKECARSLAEAEFAKSEAPRLQRVVLELRVDRPQR